MRHVCRICQGQLIFIGTLGILDWFRCRNCGMHFSTRAERPDQSEQLEREADEYYELHND